MKSLIPATKVSLLLVQGTIVAVLLVLLACQTQPAPGGQEGDTPDAIPTPMPASASSVYMPDVAEIEAGIGIYYDCINAHQELRDGFRAAYVNAVVNEFPHVERSAVESEVDILLDNKPMFTALTLDHIGNDPTETDVYIQLANITEEQTEVACAGMAAQYGVGDGT